MRIAVDTGGTFTDLVLMDEEGLRAHKLLSTPKDPALAVIEGIERLLAGVDTSRGLPSRVVHGSTVATNALLERKGARAALVTTEGFEDVLEIGRQDRPALHALEVRRIAPVIPSELRLGVRERLAADGSVIVPLGGEAIEAVTRRLEELRPESVAVVLLHSYAMAEHEERLALAIEEALGVPVTVSSRLLPEYREYERTSTCSVNAYVAPRMAGYLARLSEALADRPGSPRLRVMGSDGGTMTAEAAGTDAVHTILSGPAGGVVGGAACAKRVLGRADGEKKGEEPDEALFVRAVTFDMGGTSTDVCLVDGRPGVTKSAVLGGHPVRVPVLDIHTVGAGGGSIAWRDAAGALRVGPRSAGSDPGPACYGRGGDEPTVTDANLVLGRLPAAARLAGSLSLDLEAARDAVGLVAAELGLSLEGCAEGIVRIANVVMMRAVRRISLERGHDPRRFALVSFGGAGGLHACELASTLAMELVLVPRHPGLLSACGMLEARPERELGRSVLVALPPSAKAGAASGADFFRLEEAYRELEAELVAGLASEGIDAGELEIERSADLRYLGQSHELTVPVGEGAHPATAISAFHQAHEQAFGYRLDREVEWVTARVRARGPSFAAPSPLAPEGPPVLAMGGLHDREALPAGSTVAGPASIHEYSATTFVPSGWTAKVLGDGTLRITGERR